MAKGEKGRQKGREMDGWMEGGREGGVSVLRWAYGV